MSKDITVVDAVQFLESLGTSDATFLVTADGMCRFLTNPAYPAFFTCHVGILAAEIRQYQLQVAVRRLVEVTVDFARMGHSPNSPERLESVKRRVKELQALGGDWCPLFDRLKPPGSRP